MNTYETFTKTKNDKNVAEKFFKYYKNTFISFKEIIDSLKTINELLNNDQRFQKAKKPVDDLKCELNTKYNNAIIKVFSTKIDKFADKILRNNLERMSKGREQTNNNKNKFFKK